MTLFKTTCCWLALSLAFSMNVMSQAGSGNDLDFNGSSSYVAVSAMNLSGSALTMQAWIRVDGFKTAFPYITSVMGTETTGHTALLRIGDATLANNKLQFVLYSGSTQMKLDGVTGLNTNTWYHVAATFDGSTMRLYINGVQDASMSFSGSLVSNDVFAIGRNYGNDRVMDGQIDEVSVFQAALSQTTIREWMCKKITSGHPNYAALEGYWPLNEGSGATTADVSGNSLTGVLTASPLWKKSGAPIGDRSKYQYGSVFSLGLSHPDGDSLHVTHISGAVTGVHVYRVDSVPNDTVAPAPLIYLDTTRYWGVFVVGASTYGAGYFYDGNPVIAASNDCNIGFAERANNAATAWNNLALGAVNYSSEVVTFQGTGTKEFIAGISANGPHSFNFTLDLPECNGDSNGAATIHASGGEGPYSYDWANGSTDSTATDLGSGWHVFTITDDNGCVSTDSVLLPEPTVVSASANIFPASCLYTDNGAINMTASGGVGPYTYEWNDPDGSTTANLGDLFPGVYVVTIADAHGCEYEHSFTVGSVGPDPVPNLGPDSNVCDSVVFGLIASITGGPIATYAWSTGETSAIKIVNASGVYSLTVTNTVGCIGMDTIEISYVQPIQVDLGNDVTATNDHELDAGPQFVEYIWSTGDNSQVIEVDETGEYSVTVTDGNGCTSTDVVFVTIIPQGIGERVNAERVSVSPNPTHGLLYLKAVSGGSIGRVTLSDLTGRVLTDIIVPHSSHVLDLGPYSEGIYLLGIEKDGSVVTERIFKPRS